MSPRSERRDHLVASTLQEIYPNSAAACEIASLTMPHNPFGLLFVRASLERLITDNNAGRVVVNGPDGRQVEFQHARTEAIDA